MSNKFICKNCSEEHIKNHKTQKFCSLSCSTKFNNNQKYKSGYVNENSRQKLIERNKARKGEKRKIKYDYCHVNYLNCRNCN